MPLPHWTDEHSRLISDAAPPVAATTSAELDRVWGDDSGPGGVEGDLYSTSEAPAA